MRFEGPSFGGTERARRPVNTALHAAGVVLVLLALGMAASGVFDAADGGDDAGALLTSAAVTGLVGLLAWRGTSLPRRVSAASAFTAVAFTWAVASLAGALPFLLAGVFDHADDAVFESVSGFTTTASSLLVGAELDGRGLLLWRSLLTWVGGFAAVNLAVAVLPFLGVGGLEMVRAEAPGREPERLAPWVAHTARRLAWVYGAITAAVVLGLLASGVGPFAAVTHAMGAASTGGFSPAPASVGALSSLAAEFVLVAGMLAGAVSFTLHWRATHGDPAVHLRSTRLRLFVGWVAAAVVLVAVLNASDGIGVGRAVRDAVFNVVSFATTTGYLTTNVGAWASGAQAVLLLLILVGAMTGSAAGGMKILRGSVVVGYARREVRRARHPRGVFHLRLGRTVVPETVVSLVAGFVAVYLIAFLAGVLALGALGSDLLTSLSGAASALANVGPALGDLAPASGAAALSRPERAVLDLLMLVGRVEIFPVLLALAAPARAMAQRRHARAPARLPSRAA